MASSCTARIWKLFTELKGARAKVSNKLEPFDSSLADAKSSTRAAEKHTTTKAYR